MAVESVFQKGNQDCFQVKWQDKEKVVHTTEYDVVISCLGREADYNQIMKQDSLWKSLIDAGKAEPDPQTGRGIRVGDWGELLDCQHQRQERLTTVGLPREGDEIRRHGRLGAFTFALGPIKNQAFGSALHILRVIGDYGEPLSGFEYFGEPGGTYRDPAEVIAEAVIRTWKDRGGITGLSQKHLN